MIRIGPPPANKSNPTQELHLWRQRCIKETSKVEESEREPRYVLLPSGSRRRRGPQRADNDPLISARSSASSCSHSSSHSTRSSQSSRSNRSNTSDDSSLGSARSTLSRKSEWSLNSFCTEDSGLTYYANRRFEQFERALAEERKKREAAEAKLDRLLGLLEMKERQATKACK